MGSIAITIILGLVGFIAACSSDSEEGCYEDTPEGRKPCGKGPVPGPRAPADTDGDRVPDDKDRCPGEPHLGSPDGCASHCETDADSDGINDCEDSCPAVAGIAEASGCTDATYPRNNDYYRLVRSRSSAVAIASSNRCMHSVFVGGSANIFWSDGRTLYLTDSSGVNKPLLDTGVDDVNLCAVRKPVDYDNVGRMAAFWNQGMPGGQANVFFQRFEADGAPIGDAASIDSFPMPNLGPTGDGKIASMSVLPNGDAYVASVNRDKINVSKIGQDGNIAERGFVNTRDVRIERNFNPDIASDVQGNVAVVWQEGTGAGGPIRRAVIEAGRPLSAGVLGTVSAVPGNHPVTAMNPDAIVYLWEADGIKFAAEKKGAAGYAMMTPNPIQLSDSNVANVNPNVILDDRNRMAASWLGQRDDTLSSRIYLQNFANYEMFAAAPGAWAPIVIDNAAIGPGTSLAGDRASAAVSLLYLRDSSNDWQLDEFAWAGSESPSSSAAIYVSPNPVELRRDARSGRASLAALHLCNGGLAPLEVSWRLSSGFYMLRGNQRLSDGQDEILSETCKVSAVDSIATDPFGTITMQTNDPNNAEVTVRVVIR